MALLLLQRASTCTGLQYLLAGGPLALLRTALNDQVASAQLRQRLHSSAGASTSGAADSAAAAPGASDEQQQRLAGDPPSSPPSPSSPKQQQSRPPSSSSSSSSTPPTMAYGARLVKAFRRGGGAEVARQEGVVHVQCSLNNTICSLTDRAGNVKAVSSGGSAGFKGGNKATPLAAERAAAELAARAQALGFHSVVVRLKGLGRNKQYAVQALAAAGVGVTAVHEITAVPYNGCRLPRKRRL